MVIFTTSRQRKHVIEPPWILFEFHQILKRQCMNSRCSLLLFSLVGHDWLKNAVSKGYSWCLILIIEPKRIVNSIHSIVLKLELLITIIKPVRTLPKSTSGASTVNTIGWNLLLDHLK